MNLRKRKARLIFDLFENGEIKMSLEGKVDPSILLDFLTKFSLSSVDNSSLNEFSSFSFSSFNSTSDRVWYIICSRFSKVWFTSRELREAYLDFFGEKLPKNVASTYLYRFFSSGKLIRRWGENKLGYRYRLNEKVLSLQPKP